MREHTHVHMQLCRKKQQGIKPLKASHPRNAQGLPAASRVLYNSPTPSLEDTNQGGQVLVLLGMHLSLCAASAAVLLESQVTRAQLGIA